MLIVFAKSVKKRQHGAVNLKSAGFDAALKMTRERIGKFKAHFFWPVSQLVGKLFAKFTQRYT